MKSLIILVLGLVLTACSGNTNMQKESVGGWSNSGILQNNGQANIGLQADFKPTVRNPDPAKNYTVQFHLNSAKLAATPPYSGSPATTFFINPVAEITWSVAGNAVRRVVNVYDGVSVTGVGEAVKVVVKDRTVQSGGAPFAGSAVDYVVDITCAPGSRPSQNQPPTYNPTVELANSANLENGLVIVPPGSSFQIDVPENSGVISFQSTMVPDDPTVIVPENGGQVQQATSSSVPVKLYDPRTAEWVPIAPQIFQIFFTNNFPIAPGSPSLLFFPAFGIDG